MSDVVYSGSVRGPKSFDRLPHHFQSERPFFVPKLIPEPLLKFPQLVQKKIIYGNTINLEQQIPEKRSIRERMSEFNDNQTNKISHHEYKSVGGEASSIEGTDRKNIEIEE